jgi:DNA-binding transcriptional ArsR family regulator
MKTNMIEEVADLFKTLSDPTRLSLLLELQDGEMTVSQLADFSGTSMANISKHLTLMKRVGIVMRRKSGNQVYYDIRSSNILDICDSVCGEIEGRHSRKRTVARKVKSKPPVAATSDEVSTSEPTVKKEGIEILQPRFDGFDGNAEEMESDPSD